MSDPSTTRRALMRPAQLVGAAFVAALFTLLISAMSMGVFTALPAEVVAQAWTVAAVISGIVFIAVLLLLAMLLLAVNPADVTKRVDRAVLLPEEQDRDSSA